jgi:hypothetical protein
MTPTVEVTRHYAALERLAGLNSEALAEVLDDFARVLRGASPGPDGLPLEALPPAWRVGRLLERRAEAAELVQVEWRRLPAEAQEGAAYSCAHLRAARTRGPVCSPRTAP